MCTLVYKSIIKHYLNHNSTVYACMLDASKAFDRVRFDKLFEITLKKGFNLVDIRLLMYTYEEMQIRTVWNNSFSNCFKANNGIRQGSIILPYLFTLYMDVLLNELEANGDGCWLGNEYFGALGYADDVTLMCPSSQGLQKMLDICKSFGDEYGVKYNATKTVCIRHSKINIDAKPIIKLCGKSLNFVNHVKHLGNFVSYDLSENVDVNTKLGGLYGRANAIICNFNKLTPAIKANIFNTKCAHLYGCEQWQLHDPAIYRFITGWNRCSRRVLNIPYNARTRFLPLLMNVKHVSEQVINRQHKMYLQMLSSDNKRIALVYYLSIKNARSIIGFNSRMHASNTFYKDISFSKDEEVLTHFVLEIFNVLNKDMYINGFSDFELNSFLGEVIT